MSHSKCPLCFVKVPWTALLAHSYEMECPACHAGLELSRYTRVIAGFGGLAGAAIVMHLTRRLFSDAAWIAEIVAGVLGFGVASAICVLIAGDLVVRPKSAAPPAVFPHPRK